MRRPSYSAIIPFGEIGIDLGGIAEAGELGGPPRALRRAGQYLNEVRSAQPLAEGAGLPFAVFGQRQVGAAGMLAGEGPGGFAVPRQIDDGKRFGSRFAPLPGARWTAE